MTNILFIEDLKPLERNQIYHMSSIKKTIKKKKRKEIRL